MSLQTPTTQQICPREEIGLYLDGELSPKEEILLEKHLAVCEKCLSELNLQKQMLSALDFAFDKHQEVELPKDFTKVVVTKAESGVSGLRSKEERFRALFLSLALFLLLALGFGAESEKVFASLNGISGQLLALAEFLIHLTYDISVGIAVILRSLSQQVVYSTGFLAVLVISIGTLFFLTIPRFIYKFNRPKTS